MTSEISLPHCKFVNVLTMLLHAAIYYIQQVYNKDAHEYILSIELGQTSKGYKLFITTYYQVMYFRFDKRGSNDYNNPSEQAFLK